MLSSKKTESKITDLESKYGHLTPNGMKDSDYPNENCVRFLRFAGGQCPICGSDHWCQINVTGTKVVCQRVKNETDVINGFKYKYTIKKIEGYVYQLVDDSKAIKLDKTIFKRNSVFELAPTFNLDTMYRLVLAAYPLQDKHRQNLINRGLTDQEIELHGSRGFGSFYYADEDGKSIFVQVKGTKNKDGKSVVISRWTKALEKLNLPKDLWHGVPGFYNGQARVKDEIIKFPVFSTANGKNFGVQGMLIPYYNEYNQLVAFQIRIDEPKKYGRITKPLERNQGHLEVYIKGDNYKVNLYSSFEPSGKVIANGTLNGEKEITLHYGEDVMKEKYTFKVLTQPKYYWVSSSSACNGADTYGKLPVQVAYNPRVAKLNPDNPDERKELEKYINKPKAIWVTEGGLKGYIAANYLPKVFSEKELDIFGRDVLAVAGVNSYHKFLPMLKKLHVNSVTIAYDMDMLTNDQVAQNYVDLLDFLIENKFGVNLAVWGPDLAKGIDDALVNGVDIEIVGYE